jgi:hypothetical protein
MTLAEGREKCDFRFKKGGITNISIPAPLKEAESWVSMSRTNRA